MPHRYELHTFSLKTPGKQTHADVHRQEIRHSQPYDSDDSVSSVPLILQTGDLNSERSRALAEVTQCHHAGVLYTMTCHSVYFFLIFKKQNAISCLGKQRWSSFCLSLSSSPLTTWEQHGFTFRITGGWCIPSTNLPTQLDSKHSYKEIKMTCNPTFYKHC